MTVTVTEQGMNDLEWHACGVGKRGREGKGQEHKRCKEIEAQDQKREREVHWIH